MNPIIKICLLLLLSANVADGAELGRLFFTPEQRTRMDLDDVRDNAQPNNPNTVSVNGIVQRHGGERTVWINGVPQPAGKSNGRAPDRAPVAVPGKSQPVQVKVGQRIIVNPGPAGE